MTALLACWGTFGLPLLYDKTSIYNIEANVDQIRFITDSGTKANWYLNDIDLIYNCDLLNIKSCNKGFSQTGIGVTTGFSGSLELSEDVNVVFTRIGRSDITIRLSAKNGDIGDLRDDGDEYLTTLKKNATIKVKNVSQRYQSGETFFYNISGHITLPETTDYPDSHIKPQLTAGTVTILERSFIIDENYLIGPFELTYGDSVILANQHEKAKSVGFVVPNINSDNGYGLKVVYRTEAEHATITRYKFDGYNLRADVWNRLLNDQVIANLWVIVTLLLSVLLSLPDTPASKHESKKSRHKFKKRRITSEKN